MSPKLICWRDGDTDCAYQWGATMEELVPVSTALCRAGFSTIIEPITAKADDPTSEVIGYSLIGEKEA